MNGQALVTLYLFTVICNVLHLCINGVPRINPLRALIMGALPLILVIPINQFIGLSFALGPQQLLLLLSTSLAVTYFNLGATLYADDRPLDKGRTLSDGRRFLGDGKSYRGTVAGIILSACIGALTPLGLPLGLLIGVCTMGGDLLGSFVKRRLGLDRGHPVILLDQLDSVVLLILLEINVHLIGLEGNTLLALMSATVLIQLSGNVALYVLGMKSVPW